MLPPVLVRRLVLGPAMLVLTAVVVTGLPVLLIVAVALATILPGRWRALRLLWMVLLYLLLESVALVALFGLWVASGFGWRIRSPRFQRAHYVLVEWFLQILFWECQRVLHVRVAVEGPPPTSYDGKPLLILSRHAGPGDSFIITNALVNWYDREPRIVLKYTLQWDPAIDVVLNRLPNRFLTPSSRHPGNRTAEEHIGALATNLDSDDVLLIFPEGGNFTPRRRARAIERLRKLGFTQYATRAERLQNVLAPMPGGVLAALDAAPEAGIVLVGHTGFEDLDSVADIWRGLPLDRKLTMRWWSVAPGEVPAGREERIAWLYDWWARIDAWISEQNEAERV